MTEFLATFQVAHPDLSAFTGLKPCALYSWAFSPEETNHGNIAKG